MSFTALQSLGLGQLTSTKKVTEAKARDHMADLDGIKSVVEDALADLHDKLIGKDGSVLSLMKSTGAAKMDTVKDAEGKTVQAQLKDKVTAFKKEVEKLMTEVEILMSQVDQPMNEDMLTEGNMSYSDSAEFTEELYTVHQKITDIKKIVMHPRWNGWMKATTHNFDTTEEVEDEDHQPAEHLDGNDARAMSVTEVSDMFVQTLKKLDNQFDELEAKLDAAA